jgi:hypothetical protein
LFSRLLCFILIVVVASSGVRLSTVSAATWPNLPSVAVTMNVVNGTASYYVATFSNVPAGYDVANGVYANWCVDRRYTNVRGINIQVLLYSSLAPPGNLSSQRWDMVNYILNHKQGAVKDIQDALWYFVKMGGVGWWSGSAPSATSQAIVAEALANGNGYVPGPGGLLGAICYPPSTQAQITIIGIIRPQLPVYPLGGYSYSLAVRPSNFERLVPYLASMMILAALLVGFRRRTGTRAKGPESTVNH